MMLVAYLIGRCFVTGILVCPWLHTKKIEKSKELML